MRVYISPRCVVVRTEPLAILAASADEECVEFRFETHTPSIWDGDLQRDFE